MNKVTVCSCPAPPGGKVTCEAGQFAYCRVVDGKIESGCLPISEKYRKPPGLAQVQSVFEDVIARLGVYEWIDPFLNESAYRRNAASLGTSEGVSQYLFSCMKEGLSIGLSGVIRQPDSGYFVPVELQLKFPRNWMDSDLGTPSFTLEEA